MKKNIYLSMIALFAIAFSFSSCDKDPKPGNVNVNFIYKVGSQDLILNSKIYTSPVGYKYEIQNNKYYVSRVNLVKEDGTTVELALAHLVDVHDDASAILTKSDIPSGNYKALNFTFGLSVADDDQSVLPNTVENQNMYWPAMLTCEGLAPAFHFMKYEGKYELLDSDSIRNFNIHLGPSNKNNTTPNCNENFFDISLPFPSTVTIDDNTVNIDLVCDLQEWLVSPNTYDYEKYGQVIMPKQAAQEELKANGSTVFRIDAVR